LPAMIYLNAAGSDKLVTFTNTVRPSAL
jgi:hypothetical protein